MSTNAPMSNIPPLGPPTGMMPGGGPSKFKPIDPVRVIRGNWLWIALGLVLGLTIGGGTWYTLNKYHAKFTSAAQFNVQSTRTSLNNVGVDSPVEMQKIEPLINRELQKIKSGPTLRQVLNKPAVQGTDWFKEFNGDMEAAYVALDKEVIQASPVRSAPLFSVRATTKKGEDSQTILRALSEEYIRISDLAAGADSDQAMRAAQGRRDSAEQRIGSIEVQKKRFLDTNPIESLNEGTSEATQRVRILIVEQERLNQSLNSLQSTYNQLLQRQQEGNFDPSDEERAQIEATNEIFSIDAQMRQLRIQRDLLLDKYKEGHETIRQIDLQLLALERERADEFDNQARIAFNAKIERAANGVEILSQEMLKTNQALVEWTARRQDYVKLIQEYQTLDRAQKQAEKDRDDATRLIEKLNEFEDNDGRTIVEEYVPPQQATKSFPPNPVMMVGGIGSLMMGLVTALVFIREVFDQRVRSAQDVKMIPDASLVGMIPSVSQDREAKSIERVVELQPSGLLAEAFRQVRTAVLSKIDRRGYKTLMMVSAKPGAGVTSAAQNLAASCARSGRRVLLIDANFRRPGLAKLMSLPGQPGLSEAISGSESIEDISSLVQTSSVEGLSLLPAGDTRLAAVELFESQRFRDLLAKLEAQYDLLIIDAPPAFLTSDAQLLSRHIDSMLLVSRAQSDTRGMLQRLHRELDGQRADILGVMLNGVEAAVGGYLKRNFREFHEYSGPDRRGSERTKVTRSNGTSTNGSKSARIDRDSEQEDVFGSMDIGNAEEQDR